jgi:hypothetical protein
MLNFSGTLVERDSRIAFAALLDDLCGRSIEGVGKMRGASTRSKDFADAELKKREAEFITRCSAGRSQSNRGVQKAFQGSEYPDGSPTTPRHLDMACAGGALLGTRWGCARF